MSRQKTRHTLDLQTKENGVPWNQVGLTKCFMWVDNNINDSFMDDLEYLYLYHEWSRSNDVNTLNVMINKKVRVNNSFALQNNITRVIHEYKVKLNHLSLTI